MVLSKKLNKKPVDFIRKGDLDFKKWALTNEVLDDFEMAEFIEKYPKVLERPILVNGEKAIIGRPPENILKLFN